MSCCSLQCDVYPVFQNDVDINNLTEARFRKRFAGKQECFFILMDYLVLMDYPANIKENQFKLVDR